ncbi:MAG: YcxB family protein [Shimia sp.]
MIDVAPFELTFSEYREGQMALHHHVSPPRIPWGQVAAGIVAGGAVPLLLGVAQVPVAVPAAYLLGLAVGVGLMLGAFVIQQRQMLRRYYAALTGAGPLRVSLRDDGLLAHGPGAEARVPWSGVVGLTQGRETLTLLLPGAPLILPRRAFADPDAAAEWIGAQIP